VIIGRPPNFAQIDAAFPGADRDGVIFAYGGEIYNPSGIEIPLALIVHENMHLARQVWLTTDVWWELYLKNPEFRYNEELRAHAAEFKAQRAADRNASARLLTSTALRLIAPLYNYQPPRNLQQALKDLQPEIHRV
jgi:hypothetical protein